MASSTSSTVPSSERTSHFSSQTEMEMESSKACHWSQLDYSTTASELSAESNSEYFALLKKDSQWGRFFTDFEALVVGEKISEGAQADIYEARNTCDGPFNLVVKVMKGDVPLKTFRAQWPLGMLSARSKYKHLFDLPLITILGGTLLRDERLRGRFAFVMYRRWGDLRLLIDRRMKQQRNTRGPFPIDEAIHLMLTIAEDMDTLHNKHDILHRDLKASNVLVWGEFREDMSLVSPPNRVARLGSVVADFECSVGVMGTGLWRAPEILEQLKARVPSSKVQFTRASDVYSYGMTCYEILTGCSPFNGRGGKDLISQILEGRRPELPHDLPEFVREIILGCWHSDPSKRLTFSTICKALKSKRGPHFVSIDIGNKSQRGASILKVEKWNNPQALTLLEVMQKLMDMNLSVLKASESCSTEMITQYFEVTNWKGMDDKSSANITKALRSLNRQILDETEWISEVQEAEWVFQSISIDGNIDGNIIVQMYVVEVVAEWSAGLLRALSRLLVATNFRIHSAGSWTREDRVCWTREKRLECVIYVEGTRAGTLLWKLRHDMEYFRVSTGLFNIIVHRVAAEDFSHLNRRLHNLKSMGLTPPRSSSNFRVHQSKEFWEGFRSSEVVLCLENLWPVVCVSRNLAGMSYKICRASIECPGPYDIELRGRVNKIEGIDMGTLGEDELENIIRHRILDIATERGCPEVGPDSRPFDVIDFVVNHFFFSRQDICFGTLGEDELENLTHQIRDYAVRHGFLERGRVNKIEGIDMGTLGEDELENLTHQIRDYAVRHGFLEKGGANEIEDIDVGTFGEDESEFMIHRILDIATERGFPAGNVQLVVSGQRKELHDDLMKSFCVNDLVVTGGQVCRDGWEFGTGFSFPSGDLPGGWEFGPEHPGFPSGSLKFFVTEKRELANKYSSM